MESSYMATTASVIGNLAPKVYDGSQDIEEFIADCQRFFEVAQINEAIQATIVKAFVDRDMLATYETVDSKITDFKDRLRKAFKRPSSLIQDLNELMTYRKGTDSATVFFNKIEKMVDRVLLHKWNKQELMTYFLTHCVEDVSIRTQILMQEAKVPDSIKTVIEKMEHIKAEVQSNEIALLQQKKTFANVLREKSNFGKPNRFQQTRESRPELIKRNENYDQGNQQRYQTSASKVIECFICRKIGHMRRECPENVKRCYGCRAKGHIRRECPYLKCANCKGQGHLWYQCFKQEGQQMNRDPIGWKSNRYKSNVAGIDEIEEIDGCDRDISGNAEALSGQEMIGAIN
jgi:Zinc knuckle